MLRSTCGTRCSAENYSMLALQNRGHVSCFLLYCLSVLVGTSDMGMLLGSRWSYDLKACMMWWSREGLARQGQVSMFSSQKPSSLGFGGISAHPPPPPLVSRRQQSRIQSALHLSMTLFPRVQFWTPELCSTKAGGLKICSPIFQFSLPGCRCRIFFCSVKLSRSAVNATL